MSISNNAPLHHLGVAEIGQGIAPPKQLSSVEMARNICCNTIQSEQTGSWARCLAMSIAELRVELSARAADARLAAGEGTQAGGALLGVPLAHKDIFVTKPTCQRRPARRCWPAISSPFDATVVSRLAAAGTVTRWAS